MRERVFIVERPLQILIVIAVIAQIDKNFETNVFVANGFPNARHVTDVLDKHFGVKGVRFSFFDTYDQAFFYAEKKKIGELFIHWDVGFRTSLRIRRLKNNGTAIYVFEEGLGTYRGNIFVGIKKFIFQKMGIAVNCGGHGLVDSIFLYNPGDYLECVPRPARVVVKIKSTVVEIIENNFDIFREAFDRSGFISILGGGGKNCILYLSAWEFSPSDLDFICQPADLKILKLHPHAVVVDKLDRSDFVICPNELPAEMLIAELSRFYENVKVFHCGSSVTRYIDIDNVSFVNNIKNEGLVF